MHSEIGLQEELVGSLDRELRERDVVAHYDLVGTGEGRCGTEAKGTIDKRPRGSCMSRDVLWTKHGPCYKHARGKGLFLKVLWFPGKSEEISGTSDRVAQRNRQKRVPQKGTPRRRVVRRREELGDEVCVNGAKLKARIDETKASSSP